MATINVDTFCRRLKALYDSWEVRAPSPLAMPPLTLSAERCCSQNPDDVEQNASSTLSGRGGAQHVGARGSGNPLHHFKRPMALSPSHPTTIRLKYGVSSCDGALYPYSDAESPPRALTGVRSLPGVHSLVWGCASRRLREPLRRESGPRATSHHVSP